jgi:hypothetical protein
MGNVNKLAIYVILGIMKMGNAQAAIKGMGIQLMEFVA